MNKLIFIAGGLVGYLLSLILPLQTPSHYTENVEQTTHVLTAKIDTLRTELSSKIQTLKQLIIASQSSTALKPITEQIQVPVTNTAPNNTLTHNTPSQEKLIIDANREQFEFLEQKINSDLFSQTFSMDKLLASESMKNLHPKLREEIIGNIVNRINNGELDRQSVFGQNP
jgi:hypothetical protein